jgi:hypothetical protein
VGSGPPGAQDPCYSVDIDIDRYGGVSIDTDTSLRCLSSKGSWSGPNIFGATSDGAGGWIVTVNAPGATIAEGYAKARDKEVDPNCRAGTPTATNAMLFAAITGENGKPIKVRDIELTFCIQVPS